MLSFGFSAETLVRERGKGFRGEVWVMGGRTMSLKKNGEIPKDDRGGRQLGKFSAHLHHIRDTGYEISGSIYTGSYARVKHINRRFGLSG